MLHLYKYYYCIIMAGEIDMNLTVIHWIVIKIITFKYQLELYVFLFSNIYVSLGNSSPRGEIPPGSGW